MDFVTDPAKGAISKLVELGVESTLKQFKYMIQHKKITANLKEKLEELKACKQTWQAWMVAENSKGNQIPPNISNWLSRVEAIEVELQNFYKSSVNNNKKCFGGQCSDLALNYSQGKQATVKIEDITKLIEEGSKLPSLSYPKPPPALRSTFTNNDVKSLESRNQIMNKVIEKLKDDQFKMISICGMAGVGKTTLVKELIKIVENKLFDKVAMVIVSQNPDYEKIQKEIADGLRLAFNSHNRRGGEIHEKLEELHKKMEKVLIVLDDVWQDLNFELMGLSSQSHQKGLKILLTSRDKKLCETMGIKENVQVSILQTDEAWNLFQEMAGGIVNKHDIEPIAREVTNECGGLPLAIVTVARALRSEEKISWEDALQQLRYSQSLPFNNNIQEYLYSRIEVSLKFLGSEEHMSFLFLCGLFPEDFDISVENILRHGMGLGLFEENDAVWKIRNHVNCLVNNLKKCFLLLDSEKQGCVKMHDVVRDVVLKISSTKEHGIWVQSNAKLKQVKQKQEKWLRMSIILDAKIDSEDNLECPTLELIQVQTQGEQYDIISLPENFIHGMTKLKVVNISNLCIPILSSLFHALINLRTLQLEGCHVGDISVIGKEAMRLEILSFANSNIKELPSEIGNLIYLKLLDLTGCNHLNFIATNVFTRLTWLEELYFRINNFPWLLNKAFLEDLRNLSIQLKVLEIKLNKLDFLPGDLIFRNLKKFWVYVVPSAPYESHGYLESNMIQLRALDYNSVKSSMMTMQLIKKCEILILEKVKDLKNVISELDDRGLQCVKDLRLDSCSDLECVIDFHAPQPTLPLIESLCLNNLVSMRTVIQVPDHSETNEALMEFSYLEKMELKYLRKLIGFSNSQSIHHGLSYTTNHSDLVGHGPLSASAKLFSFDWMKQFPKLETILLRDCVSIEMVFDLEGNPEVIENGILFPLLKELDISYMDHLLYVWGNVPCSVGGFHNLRVLKISRCNSLKYVFTSVIVKAISNLEKLEVRDCEMMENIVVWGRDDKEDDNIKEHVIMNGFGKLCYLSLLNLPKLVNVYLDSVELECPSLRNFEIVGCPMLEISLLPTYIPANQDKDTNSLNIEDNSSSSTWTPIECAPFLPKFTRKRTTNKRINKQEASVIRALEDDIHSLFEMNPKKVKCHMRALEELNIEKCDLLDVIFFDEEKFNFLVLSYLKTIKIGKCDKLKSIMAKREERRDTIKYFTQLEVLHLEELPNLMRFYFSGLYESQDKQQHKVGCVDDHERISSHPFMDESLFPNLTSLLIDTCNKISILFSHSSLSSLEQLEKLEVRNCQNMQEIVSQEKIEATSNKIVLGKLKHLIFWKLPNLKAFCLSSYNFFFPSLQDVEIKDCPNVDVLSQGFSNTPKLEKVTMMIGFIYIEYMHKRDINSTIRGFKAFVESQGSNMLNGAVWYYGGNLDISNINININTFNEIVSFHKLTSIGVSYCHNLKSLFSHSMAKSLGQLLTLIVQDCKIMEKIITKEDGNIEGGNKFKNLFPNLVVLILRCLPNLECVCSIDYDYDLPWCTNGEDEIISKIQITFPKLSMLILSEVPKLKCFCSGTYDYNIMVSSIQECCNMGIFPHGNIIVNTPNLHQVEGTWTNMHTFGDLNLTIYYLLNSEKFKVELGKLETFSNIEAELVDYIKRVSNLGIVNNHKLLNFIPSNMMHIISHTKHIYFHECEFLEEIFELNDDGMIYELETIYLFSLPKLRYIWKNLGQSLAFQRLQYIGIEKCNALKYVFVDISIATSLPHLFSIIVSECDQIEGIIKNNSNSLNCSQQQKKAEKIIFPSLARIELRKLPSLKRFCRSSYPSYVELPKWENLFIQNCPKMKTFWPDGILYTPSLQNISVDNVKFSDVADVNEVIQEYNKS
ncbi:uncharacterized protein LOC131609970 [Vicia villosa]|uniref:uncharacterized protein LOC131609970 n=1 Tax=Vicia villosa TaxID=3911 RepID=UPI00273CBDCE|nr:uncharacterized protein LOC131609970 [Vicia villosa]